MRSQLPQSARRASLPLPHAVMLAFASALAALLLCTSCGGGGGGGGGSGPQPAPLVITTTSLQEGTVGTTYSTSLLATGGTAPYAWSLVSNSGSLPPELTLDPGGTIYGIAAAKGTFSFTVQAVDSRGKTASKQLSIEVHDPLIFVPIPMPAGTTNRDYVFSFEASGGHAPYTWSVQYGNLPPGLVLSTSGVISGRPTETGYFSFGVQVVDMGARSVRETESIPVVEILQVSTSSLPDINVGWICEMSLLSSGGVYPFHWSLASSSGPLPEGLTFASYDWGGLLMGIPTQSGTFHIIVQVSDSMIPPQLATKELTLSVSNQPYFREDYLPLAVVGRAYSAGIQIYGGAPPYNWKIASGVLPRGLTFDPSTGEFAGVPEEPAQSVVLGIEVTDSSTPIQTASGNLILNVNPPVEFETGPLSDAILAENYTGWPVLARWGLPPYMLRLISGALPVGLTITSYTDPNGIFSIAGVPTNLGQTSFSLEVRDSSSPPTVATKEFQIRVVPRLKLLTTSLSDGWVGEPYASTLSAEGGVPPYKWFASFLPTGLSVDESSGVISGTPQTLPYQSVFIQVMDSTRPAQNEVRYLWPPIAERLVIVSKLPPGRPDSPYHVKVGLKGGKAPYSWTLTSGGLPQGLAFDPASWLIHGTPTSEGTSNFTLQVKDTGPPVQTVSKALSLTIASNLGRNDEPATATPISNGTFRASISPYADPVAGPANPDHDFYELSTNPGSIVVVEATAMRLVPESPLDTVLEIVDAAGNRLSTCRNYSYEQYSQPCLNDDIELGTVRDSRLEFQVPDSETGPVTFYVHVFSWDGNARPDYIYELTVSGAN